MQIRRGVPFEPPFVSQDRCERVYLFRCFLFLRLGDSFRDLRDSRVLEVPAAEVDGRSSLEALTFAVVLPLC